MKEKTMSANTETCANSDKSECGYNEFRRLRYFHGMLLDDKDFREEQQYHANKRRLLNRMLHGSGVVCGLELRGTKGKKSIQVTPGLALDCSGNEIWVAKDLKIDLTSLLPPKNKPKGGTGCKEVDEKDPIKTYYIGIRYDEKPTSPVSVYLPSGDCEERTCENSRWKEGYCVEIVECCYDPEADGLLTTLCKCDGKQTLDKQTYSDQCGKCGNDPSEPNSQGAQPSAAAVKAYCECVAFEESFEKSVPCPACCSCDHACHVILGQIRVDPEKGELQTVCMNECRRYVLTGRLVQQVLLRLVGGAEDRFQVTIRNNAAPVFEKGEKFSEFIYNPIKAVYRWLTYRRQGGTFSLLDCDKKQPEQPQPGTQDFPTRKEVQEKFFTRQEVEEKLSAQRQELTNSITTIQKDLLAKQKAILDKIGQAVPPAPQDAAATDVAATDAAAKDAAAKDTTKSKKDK
jgi:hypothetical protein